MSSNQNATKQLHCTVASHMTKCKETERERVCVCMCVC